MNIDGCNSCNVADTLMLKSAAIFYIVMHPVLCWDDEHVTSIPWMTLSNIHSFITCGIKASPTPLKMRCFHTQSDVLPDRACKAIQDISSAPGLQVLRQLNLAVWDWWLKSDMHGHFTGIANRSIAKKACMPAVMLTDVYDPWCTFKYWPMMYICLLQA